MIDIGLQWRIQDFPEVVTPTLQWGRQHTIFPNFPTNCIKLQEFSPGGACPLHPLRSDTGLCCYSTIHKAAGHTCHSQNANSRMPPSDTVPASGSHSQPMDTFLFHRNCTSRRHGMAGNHETGGFINRAVKHLSIITIRK